MGMKIEQYIMSLRELGFTQKQAETIAEGREPDALTEKELLHFAAAWENDRVEPMKPLVEKYGWDGLLERLEASVDN